MAPAPGLQYQVYVRRLKEKMKRMKSIARIPMAAGALLLLLASTTGCKKLEARDHLNKGVEAYKATHYEEAINHFQQAIQDDPTLTDAKNYLATTYMYMVVPNLVDPVENKDNLANAQHAIDGFNAALQQSPDDVNALKGIATVYFNIDKFDQAKEYQKKVLAIAPNDATADYTIGVIDWTVAYKNAREVMAAAGQQINDVDAANVPKLDKKVCPKLDQMNSDLVNEGLKYLLNAVAVNPDYEDAMAYINLLYRRKSDLDCGDLNAFKADRASADQWTQKAMDARKRIEDKKNAAHSGGVTMN
jgi:tetratricopeptide (TPR) repeat protein